MPSWPEGPLGSGNSTDQGQFFLVRQCDVGVDLSELLVNHRAAGVCRCLYCSNTKTENDSIIFPWNEFPTQVSSNWKPSEYSLCWKKVSLRPITSASDKLPSEKKNFPPKTFPAAFSHFWVFLRGGAACWRTPIDGTHSQHRLGLCLNIWGVEQKKKEKLQEEMGEELRVPLSQSVEEKLKYVCTTLRNLNQDYKKLHLNSF